MNKRVGKKIRYTNEQIAAVLHGKGEAEVRQWVIGLSEKRWKQIASQVFPALEWKETSK